MTDKQQEAFNAVSKINEELTKKYLKKHEKDPYNDWLSYTPVLSVMFANDMVFINLSIPSDFEINLPEISIYSSLTDDRIYYENVDRYETFYKLIKRKFLLIKETINKVKL